MGKRVVVKITSSEADRRYFCHPYGIAKDPYTGNDVVVCICSKGDYKFGDRVWAEITGRDGKLPKLYAEPVRH